MISIYVSANIGKGVYIPNFWEYAPLEGF